MTIGIIIQARRDSSRFPDKVLTEVRRDTTILEIIIKRLKTLHLPICVATTMEPEDAEICRVAKFNGCRWYRGSTDDVLQRIIDAGILCGFDKIIRVCADNPFIETKLILSMIYISKTSKTKYDYISYYDFYGKNMIQRKFGFFAEYITLDTLRDLNKKLDSIDWKFPQTEKNHRMDVTTYIYETINNYKIKQIPLDMTEYNNVCYSVDYPYQKIIIMRAIKELGIYADYEDLCLLYKKIERL